MITTIDFETEAIGPYPDYPPKPVGVSIWFSQSEKPHYMAWGHPSGNNCTYEDAKRQLAVLWHSPMLFHNARFDMAVAEKWFGLPWKNDPTTVHDTLFLNFLHDPHAKSLSLKPSADRILGLPPTEQNALRDHLASMGYAGSSWPSHISKADAGIVGEYANGDVLRTRQLYEVLMADISKRDMVAAYRREQLLAPILNANERDGVRLDMALLSEDLRTYEDAFEGITRILLLQIGNCNPDSAQELVMALVKSGNADPEALTKTKTGQYSTAKASLDAAVKNPVLRNVIEYRSALSTLLTTFMRPWLAMGEANGGRLHPQFNQVRGEDYGTRTGRLSSSNPNFQNVPNEFRVDAPTPFAQLPKMRKYILPDEGCVIVAPDFNGQEMRIAAHFAEGRAAQIYRDDPRADFHGTVADIIKGESGLNLHRKSVKAVGFLMIYGGGVNKLASELGIDRETAARIRSEYFKAIPAFAEMIRDVGERANAGLPVRTWGGRLIPPEKGFGYKLLNHLIQGSAADQTKEAIVRGGYKNAHRRFMATVHDENVYSVDPSFMGQEVEEILATMEHQPGWDVPFKAEVKVGEDWANMAPLMMEAAFAKRWTVRE